MFQKMKELVSPKHIGLMTACGALTLTVALGSNWFTLGYDVYRDGERIGTVASLGMLTAQAEEDYYLRLIPRSILADEASESFANGESACVLYLNGEPVLAVDNEETMKMLLSDYEEQYSESDRALFIKSVTWKNEPVAEESICTADEAKAVLEGLDEAGLPLLSVMNVVASSWDEEIPFETVYENTDTLTKGHTVVKTAGQNGIVRHKGFSLIANKAELSHIDLSEEAISEPQSAVVLVGTREPGSGEGTGTYAKPCSGSFSSGFGSRWGRNHTGVDLSAPAGSSITASDSGTVKSAGWNTGGYGNLVVIDHGDGIETWYAHCSEILVKEGDVVSQGELIARVGSTGRSTGNHLHFEIRIGGTPMNPSNYLSF